MKLHKIIKYLEKKFPLKKAEQWDKVGFQKLNNKPIDPELEVNKILICMDLTVDVFSFIKTNAVKLIITRHPFIFNDLLVEKNNPMKKEIIKFLTKNNILVYSIHTNYDHCAWQIFSNNLRNFLEIKKVIKPFSQDNMLKVKLSKSVLLLEVIECLKEALNVDDIKINKVDFLNKKIDSFLISQGSGASSMTFNKMHNEIFITGEAKWSDWIYANDNNVTLITIGHYMENYFIKDLEAKIKNSFNDLCVFSFDIKNQYNSI